MLMSNQRLLSWCDRATLPTLLILGAFIRVLLLLWSFVQDRYFRVKYTDIDYMIVVDGAKHMLQGGSPFDRTTYRYTPLLAALVLPAATGANPLGKVVFAMCDLGAAAYCYRIICGFATKRSAKYMVMLFILFNPIVLNVSTRGNSDMLITFMSMAVLAKFAERRYYAAASILGFAAHFKLYPVIYVLPLVLGVWTNTAAITFSQRLQQVFPVLVGCGVCFVATFSLPTYLCYSLYGQRYLDEAFLYHIHREDHRHNFSPYWMLMYLNNGRRALGVGVEHSAGLLAFIPQLVVLVIVSWKLRRNIAHACCVETVLFVAFNKVCTVQYFVWFIPFLAFVFCEPLNERAAIAARSKRTRSPKIDYYFRPSLATTCAVITLWSLTIPLWVYTAFPLEFEGVNHLGRLWVVSCVFFLATVLLGSWLGRICFRVQQQAAKDAICLAKRL